jgi:hypothetical protein
MDYIWLIDFVWNTLLLSSQYKLQYIKVQSSLTNYPLLLLTLSYIIQTMHTCTLFVREIASEFIHITHPTITRLQVVTFFSVSRSIQLETWLLGWATNLPVSYPVTKEKKARYVCILFAIT